MRSVLVMVLCVAGCEQAPSSKALPPEPVPVEPAARPITPSTSMMMALPPCKVDEGEVLTPHMPTPAEVVAMLARSYREPQRLQVTMHRLEGGNRGDLNIVRWERTYDGVPVSADARSVEMTSGWCTRFYRELTEPKRVRRDALISSDNAVAKSGVEASKVELVHHPTYRSVQKPGTPGNNAMDYDQVLDHTDLVYIVTGRDSGQVHVDPYSGAIRARIKPQSCFGRR